MEMTFESIWMYVVIGAYFLLGVRAIIAWCTTSKPYLLTIQISKASSGQVTIILLIIAFLCGLFLTTISTSCCTRKLLLLTSDKDAAVDMLFEKHSNHYRPKDFMREYNKKYNVFSDIPGYDGINQTFCIMKHDDNGYKASRLVEATVRNHLYDITNTAVFRGNINIKAYPRQEEKNETTKSLTMMCRALSLTSLFHIAFLVILLTFLHFYRNYLLKKQGILYELSHPKTRKFFNKDHYTPIIQFRTIALVSIAITLYSLSTFLANYHMGRFMLQLIQASLLPSN